MFLTISRTMKEAARSFMRNGWLTVAIISILILSLYIISSSFVVIVAGNKTLAEVQSKINISVYFKLDVTEERIMEIKRSIESFPEIKSITFVSRDSALEKFKRDNAHREIIIQSLEVIGENPLLASLVIEAHDPGQYESIATYVSKAGFNEEVSDVNFDKNKDTINKLNSRVAATRRVGIFLGALFTMISILMTFNTIRITIYSHKKEIEIMRLVGASNSYIRLPFIFEGIIYGLVSSAFSIIILLVSLKFVTPFVSSSIPVDTLIGVYKDYFWILLGGQIVVGSLIGVIGSLIAMRKYLKT